MGEPHKVIIEASPSGNGESLDAPAPRPVTRRRQCATMAHFIDKLCPRVELAARIAALPRPIVFTNGVFDILHRGHVSYLAEARALGACLVIGLNSDASARGLGKGPDRPLNAEADRACVLAALESVTLVTLFDESTPVELLKLVRPQI